MKYILSYTDPNSHYIDIEFQLSLKGEEKIQLQLPAWRPGRYELGNFAKNIQKWQAYDENGNILTSRKLTKDLWEVECKDAQEMIVRYNYFAFELNAGSTYLDEEQLYVNPVNCLLYAPERIEEACEIELKVPKEYQVATSMTEVESHKFSCKDFDELADSPFIASKEMTKLQYQIEGVNFYIWIKGLIKEDLKKLVADFKAFSEEQGKLFGGFPFEAYHFLFQILPYKAYHGVEHCNSTVIALGPSYEVLKKDTLYDELLGVSSHELFHAWNVKRIRPIEMWPYDLSKENYSRLGYLAEGATTWYGDLMLYRSRVFDDASFLKTFSQLMNRHFNNPGVHNLSVADSSFDTWLDGYDRGVPNRKSSIYTEGALMTFMLDVEIRKGSNGKYSFDDLLRTLFNDFFKKGKGVSEADYQAIAERLANKELSGFFKSFVSGTKDITANLESCLDFFGLELKKTARENFHESYLGFVCEGSTVVMIYPESPAEKAGLSLKDEIIAINGMKISDDLSKWCDFLKDQEFSLTVSTSSGNIKEKKMQASKEVYYANFSVERVLKVTKAQSEEFEKWIGK